MTKRRTTQLLAELKQLAGQAQQILRQRLALVIEVLDDLDWIALVYHGDIDAARDALAKEYFPDIEGYITLGKLMLMYQQIGEDEWVSCRYNIAAIEIIFDKRHVKPERTARHDWKKDYDEAMQRVATLEKDIEHWKQVAEERQTKIAEQTAQITTLQSTSAHLEGRIEELERLLPKMCNAT